MLEGEKVISSMLINPDVVDAINRFVRRSGYELQREFHQAFGHPVNDVPGFPDRMTDLENACGWDFHESCKEYLTRLKLGCEGSRRGLRMKLLIEEVMEYVEAELMNDLVGVADGLTDINVISDGTCCEYGIDADVCRAEVHRSNMSKLGEDGKPIHREDGKIMKGPNYLPPNLEAIINAARAIS